MVWGRCRNRRRSASPPRKRPRPRCTSRAVPLSRASGQRSSPLQSRASCEASSDNPGRRRPPAATGQARLKSNCNHKQSVNISKRFRRLIATNDCLCTYNSSDGGAAAGGAAAASAAMGDDSAAAPVRVARASHAEPCTIRWLPKNGRCRRERRVTASSTPSGGTLAGGESSARQAGGRVGPGLQCDRVLCILDPLTLCFCDLSRCGTRGE